LFGTDGVRGEANTAPMTVETGVALGRSIAHAFRYGQERPKILIGKDTRVSGYLFENAIAAGVCSVGGDAYLMGPMPTPGVAFLTVNMRAAAGVVISASHNPFQDNGIKFFGRDGFKLDDDLENQIAEWILDGKTQRFDATGANIGKAHRVRDVVGRYIVYLKSSFPRHLSLNGMRIVLDCANGAAYKIAPMVFEELGATVTTIGTDPDGTNINAGCGAAFPERLQQKVRETGAQVGLALDGDADRCIMVDERGEIVDGDRILGLSALWLNGKNELPSSSVVATVMSNLGLEKALEAQGITMERSAVGDRYVVQKMRDKGLVLGGEQSGHIIFLNHSTTGDGMMSGLQVLAQMVEQQKPLSELASFYEPYPQQLRSMRVREKKEISELPAVEKAITYAAGELKDQGRVLVRYSGTEAKVRVMMEGTNPVLLDKLMDQVCDVIQQEIGVH